MAILEMAPEAAFSSRLSTLLRRARTIKHETSIDPPLQVSALVEGNEPLLDRVEGEDLRNLAVESAAKSILYPILGSTRIQDPSFVTVWNLLDIIQGCADRDLCSNQLVLLLVEEVLDSLSLADCRIAFSFLESRREMIITALTISKEMVILRTCNELLRRSSRAEDPVFCGRVYVFLFQTFPLDHRGSVNLRGDFHVGNVTTFEDYLASDQGADSMAIDTSIPTEVKEEAKSEEVAKPTETDNSSREDPSTLDIETLYPVFWSLQHVFSDPPRLFDDEKFKQFQRGLEATLAKFKEVPKVIQSGETVRKAGASPPPDANYDEFASAFNPKYLTSRDLFKLELSDLAFQRHILIQALILIDFLLSLTEKSKSKPHYEKAQRAMQYNFTLREEDTEWALGIKNSIANYLQDGPDGKFYYRMVDTVLSRDKNWVRWKMDNCRSFTRQRVPAKDFLESKVGARDAVSSKKAFKPTTVPSSLQFLANAAPGKGLAELRQRERFAKPSPQEYTTRIETTDQKPPNEDDLREPEEKVTSSTWRGLRLASRDQLSLFDRFSHADGLKSLFQPAQTVPKDKGGEEPRAE
ncbi:hypothetical protein N0V90_000577 [Kalmusia sp. IMI 367209]|nr:hypothetical protein N0V90_000577 [Kalmusia sp. IMI 367209]